MKDYVQGIPWKEQLIVSLVKHFRKNDENILCTVLQF